VKLGARTKSTPRVVGLRRSAEELSDRELKLAELRANMDTAETAAAEQLQTAQAKASQKCSALEVTLHLLPLHP
jgi:hypothetical protein